ncbi:class I lanthipeptide [Pedobacter sp. L105]|uniref:class I lanthipeptide n=1 Tax=Pedobacter sp. L105 TaxID=1641871 RepID=UPI00131BD93B|nr:class I lanthipeptide [Pedobacter sp. L105]
MKKVNLSEKVQLDKEIISKLTEEQLKQIEGGNAAELSCWSDSCKNNSVEEAN